jgi:hypothetical protein
MTFKTQAEIYQALLDGKKIMGKYISFKYVWLSEGNLVTEHKQYVRYAFENPQDWSIYEEPKPKKQVWQWRFLRPETNESKKPNWEVHPVLHTEESISKLLAGFKYEKHAGPFEVEGD